MNHLPGKFVWFEHVCADIAAARAFYEPLFDWHVEAVGTAAAPTRLVMRGNEGIAALRHAAAGTAGHWRAYLSVADVDAAYAMALRGGAKPLEAPAAVAGVGRAACLLDPTGAVVGLCRRTGGDRADDDAAPDRDWCWAELWTPDPKMALAFYDTVFGYDHDVKGIGDDGPYYQLHGPDGRPRAGVMHSPYDGAPPQWVPYVRVRDCDATVAQAKRLGVSAVTAPAEVDGIGRFAVLVDPLGAMVAAVEHPSSH